jgi:hypothetical protein
LLASCCRVLVYLEYAARGVCVTILKFCLATASDAPSFGLLEITMNLAPSGSCMRRGVIAPLASTCVSMSRSLVQGLLSFGYLSLWHPAT